MNARCGRACFFCRPSGEAIATRAEAALQPDQLLRVAGAVRAAGIRAVKLTGGDPALYAPLVDVVEGLRRQGFEEVEVISRHPALGHRVTRLAKAGVTQFNVSLDTLDPAVHREITGVDDHGQVLEALLAAVATGVPVKVNMVVMEGVNTDEVDALAAWCEAAGVKTLKLLDVIKDLDAGTESFVKRLVSKRAATTISDLYLPLRAIARRFADKASKTTIRQQGDLGHPMTVFTTASGFEVVVKDSTAGSWYGDMCRSCSFYPCHDALMALRLTADLRLQFCLLREDITVPLTSVINDAEALARTITNALAPYCGATFREVRVPLLLRRSS